jgi:inositol oxygenase
MSETQKAARNEQTPLNSISEWEDFVLSRYPDPGELADASKGQDTYRDHEHTARDTVREFYRLNHKYQTYSFVMDKEKRFLGLKRMNMTPWQAFDYLNQLIDDSDPDIDLPQLDHLLQTAEAIRADGHPDWFVLTGLIHDLGKILCLFNEPQWAVVGDTFPVGCKYSDKIVFAEFFADNPDMQVPEYQTRFGIYHEECGLENVHLSWGHDEYMYHVVKDYLPEPALYMIRYHSFYPAHREGEYQYLMNDHDRRMFRWVEAFSPYDLYSKNPNPPKLNELKPYYEDLLSKYLPSTLAF